MKVVNRIAENKRLFLLFLFPAFFLLHGYNNYFGLIPWKDVSKLAINYALITLCILVFALMVIKNGKKAFIFSFYLLCVYFFFGSLHDLIKGSFLQKIIGSYKILVPFTGLLSIVFCIYLKRTKRSLANLYKYIYFLVLLLFSLDLVYFFYQSVTDKSYLDNSFVTSELSITSVCEKPKPDIFFVVLDEYSSSTGLRSELNFNNNETDSLFAANNFFISRSSRSNYNFTPFWS